MAWKWPENGLKMAWKWPENGQKMARKWPENANWIISKKKGSRCWSKSFIFVSKSSRVVHEVFLLASPSLCQKNFPTSWKDPWPRPPSPKNLPWISQEFRFNLDEILMKSWWNLDGISMKFWWNLDEIQVGSAGTPRSNLVETVESVPNAIPSEQAITKRAQDPKEESRGAARWHGPRRAPHVRLKRWRKSSPQDAAQVEENLADGDHFFGGFPPPFWQQLILQRFLSEFLGADRCRHWNANGADECHWLDPL